MASRPSRRAIALFSVVVLPALTFGAGARWSVARLTSSVAVGANTFTAATYFDTVAPTVSATVISKTGQYFASSIKQGGTYYVYANATDAGAVPRSEERRVGKECRL